MALPNAARMADSNWKAESIADSLSTAWRLRAEGKLNEAAMYCRGILDIEPGHAQTLHLLGLVRWQQGDGDQAIRLLKQAIRIEPDQPRHYNNLGVICNETKLYRQAATYLQKALELFPDYHDATLNLGLSLFNQGRLDDALHCFESTVKACPNNSDALANLGMLKLVQGEPLESAKAYEGALAINPAKPRWWGNLGSSYMGMGLFSKAADCFRRAIALDGKNNSYYIGLGVALRALGEWGGTIKTFLDALSVSPDDPEVMANLFIGLQHTCQWDLLKSHHQVVDQATRRTLANGELPAEQPMLCIRRCSDVVLHQAVARAWSRHAEQQVLRNAVPFRHTRPAEVRSRIAIGYLSYDFRDHVIAHQLLPLFQLHDRDRFRVTAFSMGPNDKSVFRRRIEKECDEFIDLSTTGMVRSANLINTGRVDILVDLMGHSHHNRMGILALRPAPVQVGYLGFVASTGADFIDYVIADNVVVPESHEPFYSEKIIRLPHCYQMHPGEYLKLDTLPEKRSEWGLPDDHFVFCSFNQPYKIDPPIFNTWMRILHQIPGSVLWLYGENVMAVRNLRHVAEKAGIAGDRIIFAEKVALPRHLARLSLADLALDSVCYNGGATTSNALQAGLPVLTVMGAHWASRMTASHLLAAGLPELVARDLADYEQTAVGLARCPDNLRAIRSRLNRNHATHPLFDTVAFVRHLEKAYEMIWARHENGQPPQSLHVPEEHPPGRGSQPVEITVCHH